jgi:hypothetical protein
VVLGVINSRLFQGAFMRKLLFVGVIALSSIVFMPLKSLAAVPVYIFGDQGATFLGCVNCGQYDNNSLNNQYGTYGSPYNQMSIRNNYGDYGSPYSDTSACNTNANNPPFLMDDNGNFLGFVTVNRKFKNKIGVHPMMLDACK